MSLHIITDGGIVRTEQIVGYSLKGLLSLLDDHFVQCHKSYVLNTSHIEYINKVENIVKLRNHSILIPIDIKYSKYLIYSCFMLFIEISLDIIALWLIMFILFQGKAPQKKKVLAWIVVLTIFCLFD